MDSFLVYVGKSTIDFEKISLNVFNEICMCCFVKAEKLELVNTIPRTELFWKLCSNIQIRNTGCPQKICHVCLQTFKSIAKFVDQIRENVGRFQDVYQQKLTQLKTVSLILTPKLEPEEFEYDEPEIVKVEEIEYEKYADTSGKVSAMNENDDVGIIDNNNPVDEFFDLKNESSVSKDTDKVKTKGTKRKSTSKFKDYFDYETVLENNQQSTKIAICKLCTTKKIKTEIRMKQSNTTGLRRHLLAKHKLETADIFRDTEAATCNNPAASTEIAQTGLIQQFLSSTYSSNQKSQRSIQNTFEDMLVDWIALKYLPFHFFDDPKTQELFHFLNKDIIVPKRTIIRKKVTLRYEKIKSIIGEIIKTNNSNISFTIDGWTSIANKSYYTITAHFIDENWILQSIILDVLPSHGHQTGKDLVKLFLSTVKEFQIEKKIQAITIDNATANKTSFMQDLGKMLIESNVAEIQIEQDRHFRCFADILNVAVQDLLKLIKADQKNDQQNDEDDEKEHYYIEKNNATAINKIRMLFLKFNRCNEEEEQWLNKLKSCCDTLNIKFKSPIIVDCSTTRWSSTNEMIKLALAMKPAIKSICSMNESLKSFQISDSDWNLLQDTYKILKQFKILSTLLGCGEDYVTLPMVIVGFNMLIDNLEKELFLLDNKANKNRIDLKLLTVFTNVRDKLNKYYKKTNWIYCVILILDPRHKMETFQLTSWGRELLQNSKEKFEEIYKNNYSFPTTTTTTTITLKSSSSSDHFKVKDNDDDDDMMEFKSLYETGGNRKENFCTNNNELNMYLAVKRADKNENVLNWWKENAHIYPNLAKMARDFLSTPSATSVPSERIFSNAGFNIKEQRNRLNSESAQSLLCLNSWCTSKFY